MAIEKITAESADLTDADFEGAEVGSVVFKDNYYYLITENGSELLGEDTAEYAETIKVDEVVEAEATTTPTVSTAATFGNNFSLGYSTNYSNRSYADFVRTMQPIDPNGATATDSTNSNSNSSKSTKGVVPVGTVLCIGGIYYLVVEGGIQLLGEGSVVEGGGGNIIIAQPGSSPNITINNNYINITEINNTQTYIYNEGDKIINNYETGQLVQLDLSGYRGIDLNGQSFFINTESGQLEIEDSRDKFISYSDRENNVVAYSYVASHKGLIDGRKKSGMLLAEMANVVKADAVEILIGADDADNAIIAGNSGSSLWGGNGGTDTLTGGEGYDEFFYAIGSGNDVVKNADSSDMINLLGVSLSQIKSSSYDETSVSLQFVDGGNLRIESTEMVSCKVEETTYTFNHASGEWTTT